MLGSKPLGGKSITIIDSKAIFLGGGFLVVALEDMYIRYIYIIYIYICTIIIHHIHFYYCWWKKSCTTWDVYNPVNGIIIILGGAGFCPSTVSYIDIHHIYRLWAGSTGFFSLANRQDAEIHRTWPSTAQCRSPRRWRSRTRLRRRRRDGVRMVGFTRFHGKQVRELCGHICIYYSYFLII